MPIYRWAMPEDAAPLQGAVRATTEERIEVMLLTAGVQLVHVLRVAADMHQDAALWHALRPVVIASIGPMTSEELWRQGLPGDLEPSHPKWVSS